MNAIRGAKPIPLPLLSPFFFFFVPIRAEKLWCASLNREWEEKLYKEKKGKNERKRQATHSCHVYA